MYCSSCGVALAQGLTYCNYCGAKINSEERTGRPYVRPEGLLTMMGATFIMGTFAITLLMGVMKAVLQADVSLILAVALLPFSLMFILEALFIFLLLRGSRASEKARDRKVLKERATNELDAVAPRALSEPAPSVTENTTRAFDPVYSERR